jgi:hypothetical protein
MQSEATHQNGRYRIPAYIDPYCMAFTQVSPAGPQNLRGTPFANVDTAFLAPGEINGETVLMITMVGIECVLELAYGAGDL